MHSFRQPGAWVTALALVLTLLVYIPGLSGGWLFDDYPNIVNNHGVQPADASFRNLVRAALSSPASEFRRPLASLSFAANYLVSGLDPYNWKLTNLVIHLLNGTLLFLLTRELLLVPSVEPHPVRDALATPEKGGSRTARGLQFRKRYAPTFEGAGTVAAVIAGAWMLLPINLTAVLYVVQRMESLANLFVLLGLLGYVAGRRNMLAAPNEVSLSGMAGLPLCVVSIVAGTGLGVLAKETAVMLPLYAALTEWMVFGFCTYTGRRDKRVVSLFVVVLLLPLIAGLVWLLPKVLSHDYWSTRNFDLRTRLWSETRIVVGYLRWTLLPTPDALSFYHDDFRISQGPLNPWTTLGSCAFLAALVTLLLWLRKRRPLAALGIALFLACQLLTGTILPLELIFEHRNYFASFGLLLALVPLLAVPRAQSFALPRHALLAGLIVCWTTLTGFTAYAWGDSLRLAEDLASRAPDSPRAQYELGRTYIIYSHYNPTSPFTALAYGPLERAASLPESSILPQQALIFMNSRMHLPLKDAWWDSMIAKLKAHQPGVQDESSLAALTQCARDEHCNLPQDRMVAAFTAAISHPHPDARLLATYGDYAWNVLDDQALGERMTAAAVEESPGEPAYQITLIRMLLAQRRNTEAISALKELETLNVGGRIQKNLDELHDLSGLK